MGVCQSDNSASIPKNHSTNSQSIGSHSPISPTPDMSNTKIPMKNDSESIIKRLIIILSEYYTLTKDNKNETLATIDWSDLFGPNNNYSDESLINDFNYILDIYNDNEDIQGIHNRLLKSIDDKQDVLNNFANEKSILYRHLVCDKWTYNTKELISNLYFGCKDHNDIIKYKILDKMFCHLMYPHILGLRLSEKDMNLIQVAASSEQKDKSEEDLDIELNKLNDILKEKREIWIKLKSKEWLNKYSDDKFVTYLTKRQKSEESKSSNDGKNESEDRPKNKEEDKEKEKQHKRKMSLINEYSIGTRYYYDHWNYYSENQAKLKIESTSMIRGSHYANLKAEMIQSNAISMEEWLLLELYCKVLFESKKCKKLKCDILKSDGHGVDIHYGFQQGDNIHLEHIISVYIYCNFPDIKRRFHRHLTNNKYSNFGRLLRETVEGFGISVFHDDSENQFYHNICVKNNNSLNNDNNNNNDDPNISRSYFNGYLALKFCKPTLMTTYNNIIHLYNMENKHITLNLCKYTNNSSVNYFNCNWISDNSLDNECLFIGGKYALKLQSIIIENIYNYGHYLRAIHVLHSLIKGKANILPIDQKLLFAIETLTKNKLQFNKNRNDKSRKEENNDDNKQIETQIHNDYIMKIFSKFCQNITIPIYINLIWILDSSKNGYNAIKQWITNEDNSWIRFDVLCSLFPNVEKVKIGHSQFNLQNSTFDTFIEFFGGNNNNNDNDNDNDNQHRLQEIEIEDPNESNVSVKNIITSYQSKLSEIGWKMESNKYYTKIFLTKKAQENLWDDLF